MNYSTLMKVGLVFVIAIGVFVVMRLISPSPANAPSISEATFQPVMSDDPEFVQFAPTDSPPEIPAATPSVVQEKPATIKVVTISMTDTGFVPSSVTVAPGAPVSFLNDGQGLHWPASNDHPNHLILPEFDAKKGLATGESYTHTFTKKGIWKFHDHLNASFQGVIVVE